MVMKKSFVLVGLLILFHIYFASSYVGVSPAAYSVDFQPNLRQVFNFNFYSDDPQIQFNITAEGDLAQYMELSREGLSGNGNVNVLLKLPKKIDKPGVHRLYISAIQMPKEGQGTLGIVANLRAIIDVRVPYPGKYAEGEFSASNANAGEDAEFKLKLYSRGDEDIVATSFVELYDFAGKKIDTITLGINEIKSKESIEIVKNVDTKKYPAGKYRAVVVVQYYDKELKLESPFRLGELSVDIIAYKSEFEKEKINNINIDIESSWNDPIENVYAEITILGYESVIPTFLTPSVNLGGFERKTIEGYFDTTQIEEDKFKARIVLHYLDKTTEKVADLKFRSEVNYMVIGIIVGIVVLAGIILFLILWIRKLKKVGGKAKK